MDVYSVPMDDAHTKHEQLIHVNQRLRLHNSLTCLFPSLIFMGLVSSQGILASYAHRSPAHLLLKPSVYKGTNQKTAGLK